MRDTQEKRWPPKPQSAWQPSAGSVVVVGGGGVVVDADVVGASVPRAAVVRAGIVADTVLGASVTGASVGTGGAVGQPRRWCRQHQTRLLTDHCDTQLKYPARQLWGGELVVGSGAAVAAGARVDTAAGVDGTGGAVGQPRPK
mmetsp:Transcript_27891/g.88638  ORF Transcript_27891/g.88638 Transcript_27891/m.88638 type:complete len:143 (-) Transcript_27891:290-718(-)